MQARLESAIEQNVCRRVHDTWRVESIKLNLQGNRGWPDRMFLLPLRPAWIEFKRPGGKNRKLQEYRAQQMKELGYDVATFDNEEDAVAWLKELYTARLPEARDKTNDLAGLRWTTLGSWPREDFYKPRCFEVAPESAADKRRTRDSTAPRSVQRVAQRDRKVD